MTSLFCNILGLCFFPHSCCAFCLADSFVGDGSAVLRAKKLGAVFAEVGEGRGVFWGAGKKDDDLVLEGPYVDDPGSCKEVVEGVGVGLS